VTENRATPHQNTPSLHECQIKLRELAAGVGQGVLELRRERMKWADLIKRHEEALADKECALSHAIEQARIKGKAITREDGKRQTAGDLDAYVKDAVREEQRILDIEEALIRHAKRLEATEIKYLEGLNDAAEHERAIWNALLRSVMQEMSLAGTPDQQHRTRYA